MVIINNNKLLLFAALTQIVIAAPHGGSLRPSGVPVRPNAGCYNAADKECSYSGSGCSSAIDTDECSVKNVYADTHTDKIAELLADSIQAEFGNSE